MKNVLLVDIGSSHIKARLQNTNNSQIMWERIQQGPLKIVNDNEFIYEIDPQEYVDFITDTITELEKSHRIDDLYIATQMHGYVYDIHQKNIYVSWQDRRSMLDSNYLHNLEDIIPKEVIRSLGIPLKSSIGILNLSYDLEQMDMGRSGELFSLGSYINVKLGGKNIVHTTNAAPMGILDINTLKLNNQFLKFFPLEKIIMPTITDNPLDSIGEYKSEKSTINLHPDLGDQQVSVYGTQAHELDAIINVATASQVSIISNKIGDGSYETRPYFNNQYLHTTTNLMSGRNLEVVVDFIWNTIRKFDQDISIKKVWQYIQEVPKKESNLWVDLNFYNNQGSIENISINNFDIENIVNGCFKSMSSQYIESLNKMGDYQDVILMGGVLQRNKLLCQYIDDNLSSNSIVENYENESLVGLFRIACQGVVNG